MILQIITVGTLKEGYLKEALAEYKKRLSQYARVEETSIAEVRIANEDDKSEIARALSAEGDKIISCDNEIVLVLKEDVTENNN